jgi:hypothetical protein
MSSPMINPQNDSVVVGRTVGSPVIDRLKTSNTLSNAFNGISIPDRINFVMDNSADSVNTKAFYIFDAIGAVTNLESISATAATPDILTHAILIQYVQARPIVIKGLRLQATTSSTQFNNSLTLYRGDLDGTVAKKNFFLSDAIEGDKYDEKIQSYSFPHGLLIDLMTMFKLTVNASEKVYVTMFLWKDFLRIQ